MVPTYVLSMYVLSLSFDDTHGRLASFGTEAEEEWLREAEGKWGKRMGVGRGNCGQYEK